MGWATVAQEGLSEAIAHLQPIALLWLLILLLTICIVLGSLLILFRPRFVEHKGAFFKRKPGDGYHEAVYCGACKKPTATGSYHTASHFKCICGWESEITKGDLPYVIKELL